MVAHAPDFKRHKSPASHKITFLPFCTPLLTSRIHHSKLDPMPIYEFYSPDTHKIYSFFARSISMRDKLPRCPEKPDARMEKVVSAFAVTGRHKARSESGDDPLGSMDPSAMEGHPEFQEIERELSALGDKEPDPRQLGSLMRKMTRMMGEKVPEPMQEMIARLEKGEDPESLEEKFGDAFDQMDGDLPEGLGAEWQGLRQRLGGKRQAARDPKLYEMSEFL